VPQGPEPRSRAGSIFDAVSISLFVGGWLWLLLALWVDAGPGAASLSLLVLALPALLAAELAAGAFHWFADTFFTPQTRWIGPAVIRSFRDHHTAPADMALRSAAEVSGQNCFACVPMLALAAPLELASSPGRWLAAGLLLFTFGIAATNLFHQWAHSERVPPFVAELQRRGLILSPQRHALHHCGAHDRSYCVTTGWLNPLLDAVGFFPTLERCIRGLARLAPRARSELAKGSRAH
jgi:ubiquitin-conjugating enzyme E2 variant